MSVSVQYEHYTTLYNPFLPPADEVWGKVMFLHLSVILFTGEGVGFPIMHHRPHDKGQGVCIQGGSACMRGVYIWGVGEIPPRSDTTGYGQQVGGTHTTGMYSCLLVSLLISVSGSVNTPIF